MLGPWGPKGQVMKSVSLFCWSRKMVTTQMQFRIRKDITIWRHRRELRRQFIFYRYGRQAAYEACHGYSSKLSRPKSSLLIDQLSKWSGEQFAELFQINFDRQSITRGSLVAVFLLVK
jgi:hypothetical protein